MILCLLINCINSYFNELQNVIKASKIVSYPRFTSTNFGILEQNRKSNLEKSVNYKVKIYIIKETDKVEDELRMFKAVLTLTQDYINLYERKDITNKISYVE